MEIKIAKDFWWEMSHRLPFHDGLCRNLHGHTYKMTIELTGTPDKNGIVMDYYHIHEIVSPVLNQFDHSFLCDESDILMINFLKENNFKHVEIKKYSTSENIAEHLLNVFKKEFSKYNNISTLCVRIFETTDVSAEASCKL